MCWMCWKWNPFERAYKRVTTAQTIPVGYPQVSAEGHVARCMLGTNPYMQSTFKPINKILYRTTNNNLTTFATVPGTWKQGSSPSKTADKFQDFREHTACKKQHYNFTLRESPHSSPPNAA